MKTTINDHSAYIVLDETFDFKCVESFRSAYENLEYKTIKNLNVDFRNTRYMDSSALGMLLNLRNYVLDKNVRISIINSNEQIKKIFNISRFDKKFNIE